MATVVVVAVVVAFLTNATLVRDSNPSVASATSQGQPSSPSQTTSPSVTPSQTPSTSTTTGEPTGPTQQGTIPPGALLTTAKLRPAFSGLESPFAQPFTPNPSSAAGPMAYPAGSSSATLWTPGFQSGAAHQTMTAISQLMAGACAGPFQIVRGDLGGDESILISSGPNTVFPQAAHGKAIHYAIERWGDYLVWITLIDQAPKTGPASLAVTLTSRTTQQMRTTIMC